MGTSAMLRITGLYVIGFISFVLGTQVRRLSIFDLAGRYDTNWSPSWFRLTISEAIIVSTLVLLFVISKIAIIPLGVYHNTRSTLDLMGGPLWSFSMFCSEMLLSLAIIVLFSKSKHNERWFFVLSAINADKSSARHSRVLYYYSNDFRPLFLYQRTLTDATDTDLCSSGFSLRFDADIYYLPFSRVRLTKRRIFSSKISKSYCI